MVSSRHLPAIPIVKKLRRILVCRNSNLSFLLLITIMSGMCTSIISHNTAFFAHITKIMWLIPSNLYLPSRILSAKLISPTLIRVILLGLYLHIINNTIIILQHINWLLILISLKFIYWDVLLVLSVQVCVVFLVQWNIGIVYLFTVEDRHFLGDYAGRSLTLHNWSWVDWIWGSLVRNRLTPLVNEGKILLLQERRLTSDVLHLLLLLDQVVVKLSITEILCSLTAYQLLYRSSIIRSLVMPGFHSALSSRILLFTDQLVIDSHGSLIFLTLVSGIASLKFVRWQKIVQILFLLLILAKNRSWLARALRNILIRWNKSSCLWVILISCDIHVAYICLNGIKLIGLDLLLIVVECCVIESTLLTNSLPILSSWLSTLVVSALNYIWRVICTSHRWNILPNLGTLPWSFLSLCSSWSYNILIDLSTTVHLRG